MKSVHIAFLLCLLANPTGASTVYFHQGNRIKIPIVFSDT